MKALEKVIDPETGLNVVEMGMIRDVVVKDDRVKVIFSPTTPFCPMLSYLVNEIRQMVKSVEGVGKVEVKIVT